MTLSTGARALKRGDTFDIEDSRTSHRLKVAHSILRGLGLEPTWTHSDYEVVEWGRPKHGCDYRCQASWPELATDEIFEHAWQLACAFQDSRGAVAAKAINAARR